MAKKIIQGLAIIFLVCCLFFFSASYFFIENTKSLQKADAILVLGFKVNEDGNLSPTLKSRVDKGIELYKNGFAKYIVFSGGAVSNRHTEAQAMMDYSIKSGIPKQFVFAEKKSQNTVENVFNSNFIFNTIKAKKIIVVTSAYHTKRAKRIFEDYNYETQFVAVEYPSEIGIVGKFKALIHECLSWLYYSVNGFNTKLSTK